MAVEDARFRVRGVAGLRVADTNTFPRTPGAFPVFPTLRIERRLLILFWRMRRTKRGVECGEDVESEIAWRGIIRIPRLDLSEDRARGSKLLVISITAAF
jgi:hypothetical protein